MRRARVAITKYALKDQIDWDGELEILDVRDDGVGARRAGDGDNSNACHCMQDPL